MWEKIKNAWATAVQNMRAPWIDFWTLLKDSLIGFITVVAKALWGLVAAVWEILVAFIKTVYLLCFNWLIELIKKL